jgi:hypothetical protein
MESKWNEPLDEIMGLVHDTKRVGRVKTITRAKEVKNEILTAWADAQNAVQFLDNMINRYLPGSDWPQGFFIPPQPGTQLMFQPGVGMVQQQRLAVSLIIRPEQILEIAMGLVVDGAVETKDVISQLRALGDQRPDRSLAVSVGNVLIRRGWERVGSGKYRLKQVGEVKKKEDAKQGT